MLFEFVSSPVKRTQFLVAYFGLLWRKESFWSISPFLNLFCGFLGIISGFFEFIYSVASVKTLFLCSLSSDHQRFLRIFFLVSQICWIRFIIVFLLRYLHVLLQYLAKRKRNSNLGYQNRVFGVPNYIRPFLPFFFFFEELACVFWGRGEESHLVFLSILFPPPNLGILHFLESLRPLYYF